MGRKVRTMMFRSKLPSLIGNKQQEENRVIRVQEIADATGLKRATIYKWLGDKERFKVLDPDSTYQLCLYFNCSIDELVDIVPADEQESSKE